MISQPIAPPQTSMTSALRRVSLSLFALLCAVPCAAAQGKPDQVYVWNSRRGEIQIKSGTITQDDLAGVKLTDKGGKESRQDPLNVRRVVWGDVPPSFSDGRIYFERTDYENAVAKFRIAATDAEARPVVQAAARYNSTRSLLAWGANDASRFTEAAQEADRFLTAFPENRYVPLVRELKARATLLSGDAKSAADEFRSLYAESDGPTKGYDFLTCARAGHAAAHAFLTASEPDTVAARELFSGLASKIGAQLVELDEEAPERAELSALQESAQLGEGYVLLATKGQARQAKTFFESRIKNKGSASQRFGAQLGYALALQSEGELQKARIQFAKVAALDHTDRDRAARALLGMAECSKELKDSSESAADVRLWLEEIVSKYGDTPSARKARELLSE